MKRFWLPIVRGGDAVWRCAASPGYDRELAGDAGDSECEAADCVEGVEGGERWNGVQ